uniref:hypothetical protein n=1 Tax=Phascolarctobacterium succinatutens TaxID=626940 RepID=UPI0040275403
VYRSVELRKNSYFQQSDLAYLKLFGKTFSRKSFCFAALSKKRKPFLQLLSVMKEVDVTNHAGDFVCSLSAALQHPKL